MIQLTRRQLMITAAAAVCAPAAAPHPLVAIDPVDPAITFTQYRLWVWKDGRYQPVADGLKEDSWKDPAVLSRLDPGTAGGLLCRDDHDPNITLEIDLC